MIATNAASDEISSFMKSIDPTLFPVGTWLDSEEQSGEADIGPVEISWRDCVSSMEQGESTSQITVIHLSQWETEFTPRTDLGKKLYALRAKAIAAGMKLLSEEEVLEEMKRRRGEIVHDEKDVR